MVLNTPMNVSENIGVAVGANFLAQNATQIQSYWDSWNKDGETGNRDGVFDPGEGFSLTNLADVGMDRHHSISTMNNLALARFNPCHVEQLDAWNGYDNTLLSGCVIPNQSAVYARSRHYSSDSQIGTILSATPMSTASQTRRCQKFHHRCIRILRLAISLVTSMPCDISRIILRFSNPAALVNIDLWADTHTKCINLL